MGIRTGKSICDYSPHNLIFLATAPQGNIFLGTDFLLKLLEFLGQPSPLGQWDRTSGNASRSRGVTPPTLTPPLTLAPLPAAATHPTFVPNGSPEV